MADTAGGLTAREAADVAGVSERTVRRAVVAGRLAARHLAPNRLAIAAHDLEAWRRERAAAVSARTSGHVPPAVAGQLAMVGELAERVAALERQVAEMGRKLEARQRPLDAILGEYRPWEGAADPSRGGGRLAGLTVRHDPPAVPDDLPHGSALVAAFGGRHGMSPSTARRQAADQMIASTERPHPVRANYSEHWLTPAQQRPALEEWARQHKPLHRCEDAACVCRELLDA